MRFFLLSALLLLVPAVAWSKTVVVDGLEVNQKWWDQLRELVLTQGAFDLNCPKDQLTVTLMAVTYKAPNSVGLRGCAKQGRYVRIPGTLTWSLNAQSADPSPAEPSSPPTEQPPAPQP